jgi:tetratricopeptide (TPR) repeat protein
VANLMVDAERAERLGDAETSLERREGVCALEPGRTEHRIGLGQAQARARRYDEAVRTLEDAAADPEITHTLASTIDEWLGDLALHRGELDEAGARYRAALGRSVDEPVARRLQLKELGSRDPGLAVLLLDYFAPFEPPEPDPRMAARRVYVAVQIRELGEHDTLGSYLVGYRLLDARDGGRAAEAFERALAPGPDDEPLPTAELLRGAREGLLVASVRQRDYARARQVLRELLEDPAIGNGDRYTYQLWAERIEFFEVHRPTDAAER